MRNSGFTYIEMIIALAIMGILLVMAVPSAKYQIQKQKEQELRAALLQIRTAIDNYKKAADAGHILLLPGDSGYPKTLDDLVEGVTDALSPDHHKQYFLRSMPRDPFYANTQTPASLTWALRSYSSPPEAPAPGADVFDVHSQSTQKGLNGIPYNQW